MSARCRAALALNSPVQVVLLHLVVTNHPEQLHILAQETGRQQPMDAKLQPLLQREGHALENRHNQLITLYNNSFHVYNLLEHHDSYHQWLRPAEWIPTVYSKLYKPKT